MKLRYGKRALHQIDEVLGHIAKRSPQGAAKVAARMAVVLALLQSHPHTGVRTTLPRVRRIFLTPYPYLIDYHAGDDEVVVLRFRHTARRPVR